MDTSEQEQRKASHLGDVAIHLASVVGKNAEQLLEYCKEHNIKIDYFERKQWLMLIKCTQHLHSLVLNQNTEYRKTFENNVKIFGLLMRLIISRTDDDDLKLYKWYNYIKTFPADFPDIQPTAEEEAEAFKHIFE